MIASGTGCFSSSRQRRPCRCRLSELPESPSNPVAHLIGNTSGPHRFEYSAVLTARVPLLPERHGIWLNRDIAMHDLEFDLAG